MRPKLVWSPVVMTGWPGMQEDGQGMLRIPGPAAWTCQVGSRPKLVWSPVVKTGWPGMQEDGQRMLRIPGPAAWTCKGAPSNTPWRGMEPEHEGYTSWWCSQQLSLERDGARAGGTNIRMVHPATLPGEGWSQSMRDIQAGGAPSSSPWRGMEPEQEG